MRRALSRFANLFRRRAAEREMAREVASHLALLREDFEVRGMPPEEAALAARRAYGGVEQAKELHREARTFIWVEQLFRDLRYGWNNLRRSPGFTINAALALALAMGVNTTLFAIYNTVVLKPLPVSDPSRVFRLKRWFERKSSGNIQYNFAYLEYQYLRDHSSGFAAITASSYELPVLATIGNGPREHLRGHAVSANYFKAMGVPAYRGRTFLPSEDRSPGGDTVVVLSYSFWQHRFAEDPNVVGRSIKLDDVAYTIIGIAPEGFTGTDLIPTESAFWAPISMVQQLNPGLNPVLDHWYPATQSGFQLLARLNNNVSLPQAQAETSVLLLHFLKDHHEPERTTAVTLRKTSYFDDEDFLKGLHQIARLSVMLVIIVLVAACVNIANMLLARGVERQREIGIRLALGAGRARVVRQLLTESVLLALIGGVAGVLISGWAGRLLWLALSHGFEVFELHITAIDFSPDARLIAFGAALSIFTAILFGLAPAFRATRQGLREQGHSTPARSRLRAVLLGAQVAVATLLLSGMSDFSSIVRGTAAGQQGFDTRHAWLLNIHDDNPMAAMHRVREKLAARPEIASVAIGGWPSQGASFLAPVTAGALNRPALITYDSDGYFETMGIPLLRGRGFTRQEAANGAPVAVVSESTARHYWPGADPLGRHFSIGSVNVENGNGSWRDKFDEYEVVGVARDIHFRDVAANDASHVYLPLGVTAVSGINGGLVYRLAAGRTEAAHAVEAAVESVDPSLLADMQTMTFEDGPIKAHREVDFLVAGIMGGAILIALLLAGVGIYGVVTFLVTQRTREIGIRIAVGASTRNVIREILIDGLRPALIGMALGFALAAAFDAEERTQTIFPDTMLHAMFGDPWLYAALAVLLALALAASIIPARRAAQVDPVIALRCE